jgi:RNA polymerase sigma-70 factor (ECF subfamily)
MHRPTLGDAAFDRLVRAHRASLERYVRGLGASREDAEEIVATALLRAYQSPPAAHLEREWRAWLSTVARNLWIDARRRRQVRLVAGDGVLEAVASPPVDQIAATAEEARQICAAIALLPPRQRAAVYLREVRGLSYEEIADELAMTLKAVTATLHRARDNVRHRRGGMAEAFSGLVLTPLVLLRRGAGAARSVGASGAAAKVVLPVVLVAGTGGAAVVAQHGSARAGTPAPRAAIRWLPSPVGTTGAKRAALGILGLATTVARVPARAASPQYDEAKPRSTARLPGDSQPAAAATEAGAPAGAPTVGHAGSNKASHPARPTHVAPVRHVRKARPQHTSNAQAQHSRKPPHARPVAGEARGNSVAQHDAAPPASTRASSRVATAAQPDHAAVAHEPSAARVGGGSHSQGTSTPAAPATPTEPDAVPQGAAAGGAATDGAAAPSTPAQPADPPAQGKSTP